VSGKVSHAYNNQQTFERPPRLVRHYTLLITYSPFSLTQRKRLQKKQSLWKILPISFTVPGMILTQPVTGGFRQKIILLLHSFLVLLIKFPKATGNKLLIFSINQSISH